MAITKAKEVVLYVLFDTRVMIPEFCVDRSVWEPIYVLVASLLATTSRTTIGYLYLPSRSLFLKPLGIT